MQLIGIISFPKRETFSMGYFIEKQEWCDKCHTIFVMMFPVI